jgi:predicted chitinase
MELQEAHDILRGVTQARPTAEWDTPLATAVQRGLAEVYLLNPNDDVDGKFGKRSLGAWKLFRETAELAPADTIGPTSAGRLVQASSDRAAFMGKPLIELQPDFEFRRSQNAANRQRSAAAIMEAAKAQGLTRPQIAYVLATAEHESAGFATLEEFASGDRYEGRADLGNNQAGDGRRFKGRGYVQLTGRNNYTAYGKRSGIRLVNLPFVLMNWAALSVYVIVDGMMRGAYTGRRLDEFVNAGKQDFRNARKVVNGLDAADKIAVQATEWLGKLE